MPRTKTEFCISQQHFDILGSTLSLTFARRPLMFAFSLLATDFGGSNVKNMEKDMNRSGRKKRRLSRDENIKYERMIQRLINAVL